MKTDELSNRMKDYEVRTRSYLPRRCNAIIRIDGKAFHSYTKQLNKPFDDGLMEDMAETTKYLCKNIQGAKIGYTQSDEISIILTDYDTIKTDMWFGGEVQKIVSVSASMATAKFNQLRFIRMCNNLDGELLHNMIADFEIANAKLAEFDARVYSLPSKEEVVNYFIWRQQDASRNSVSMAARAIYSHSALEGKNQANMHDMLMAKNINWNDFSAPAKRGWCVIRKPETWVRSTSNKEKPFKVTDAWNISMLKEDNIIYEKDAWSVDNNIPIFVKDRSYILKTLPKN